MSINLASLYEGYIKKSNSQLKSNLNTALFRYTLPALGFVIPSRSAKRFHPYDIQIAIEFLSQFDLEKDTDSKLLEAQAKVLSSINSSQSNTRHQRKILKDFVGYFDSFSTENLSNSVDDKSRKHRSIVEDLTHLEKNRKRHVNKKKISLCFDPSKYENHVQAKKELQRIEKELKEMNSFFAESKLRPSSKATNMLKIKVLLGWQFLQYKDLDKVGIESLVIPINIYPSIEEYDSYEEYCVACVKAKDKAKKAAKRTISFVKNFFIKYEVTNKETKKSYIHALISIAKYLYKDITDEEEYIGCSDISVVRRLKILRQRLPENNKAIEPYFPSWGTVVKSLLELKSRADQELYFYQEGYRKGKVRYSRDKKAIALDLQKFLILGFFVLVPPPRVRVVAELSIGRTLKHGLFIDGIFVAHLELKDKSQSKYYIHLQPEDYKTGDKYGEWLASFPNFKFDDGSTFYDYLDKWIYSGYREQFLCQNNMHNYLFSTKINNAPFNRSSMSQTVNNIFLSTINFSIRPQKLRTIYRTYLADIGADQQTLESSAFWMRHSTEIAKEVYTKQTLDNRLRPGLEAINQINNSLLKEFNNHL